MTQASGELDADVESLQVTGPGPRRAALPALLMLVLSSCAGVPLDYPKTPTSALADTDGTSLAAESNHWRRDSPDSNGFYPLEKGLDAFGGNHDVADVSARR